MMCEYGNVWDSGPKEWRPCFSCVEGSMWSKRFHSSLLPKTRPFCLFEDTIAAPSVCGCHSVYKDFLVDPGTYQIWVERSSARWYRWGPNLLCSKRICTSLSQCQGIPAGTERAQFRRGIWVTAPWLALPATGTMQSSWFERTVHHHDDDGCAQRSSCYLHLSFLLEI